MEKIVFDIQKEDKSFVSWTVFWSIFVLGSIVITGVVNNLHEMIDKNDVNYENQIQNLEKKVNASEISTAKIETQYTQIQADLAEIKTTLKKVR